MTKTLTTHETLLSSVQTEFARYRRNVELAIEQVSDADLHATLDTAANSIATLLGHLSGNLRSRFTDFLTTDGEKAWRDRDSEFVDRGLAREAMLAEWQTAWDVVGQAIADIERAGSDVWQREVMIRNQPLTVTAALMRSIAHVATHAGQIVLLARHHAGPAWRTLSIARGDSAAYARNPTREKSPDGGA
ncbi:MAG: DUF1572 domain-containing protein [bacterium]|nr:DUF1572 domain-containing protein [bacterium]